MNVQFGQSVMSSSTLLVSFSRRNSYGQIPDSSSLLVQLATAASTSASVRTPSPLASTRSPVRKKLHSAHGLRRSQSSWQVAQSAQKGP